MKLLRFQVFNYRSINDSGPIEVRDRTALVGRNESGKTNILSALESLNPPGGMVGLSYVKDFPRDRQKSDFSEDLTVVTTTWELTQREQGELESIFPRAKGVSQVEVGRRYHAKPRWVSFENLQSASVDAETVSASVKKIMRSTNGSLKGVEDPGTASAISTALSTFVSTLPDDTTNVKRWSRGTLATIQTFQNALQPLSFTLPEHASDNIKVLADIATQIENDDVSHQTARDWVVKHLPKFIYLQEYPELQGHQNIPQYITRCQQDESTRADENFSKLCKVAGLDPEELNDLLLGDHETRQQLVNRAGYVVTKKIRELWTDRELTIRFNLDANHFDTLVSDPSAIYPVEINLNERSRGFKWFFSFYIAFAADTADGPAEDAILLLDEPGLHLHAIAQQNLLDHFARDFQNTIVYTTHSPFMIPVDDLPSIRTLNITQELGTTVTNDPTGDEKTLFPIQAALGYSITQSLFIGNGLVLFSLTPR